ncbi:MAG: peptidylprolyl isomerase [Acidobacteriota bacterium]
MSNHEHSASLDRVMLKTYRSQTPCPAALLFRSDARAIALCALLLVSAANAFPQRRTEVLQNPTSVTSVPKNLLLRIVRAEDERRWDNDLRDLLSARSALVRKRAALAAGRIGNEGSVSDLTKLLQGDDETDVRAMAAFALGEVESLSAGDALVATLKDTRDRTLRARTLEALGKIAAAVPSEQEARAQGIRIAILDALKQEAEQHSRPDKMTILLGLTATLRAKPANSGPTIARFLTFADPRIRADAGNTLARLRLNDGNGELRKLLISDPDPVVRANAARVLGATEDKGSFEALLDRALKDEDSRVRVTSIRALMALKDSRATVPLVKRGGELLATANPKISLPSESNEILEIATALGRIAENTRSRPVLDFLVAARTAFGQTSPEVEIAKARVAPQSYTVDLQRVPAVDALNPDGNWRVWSAMSQGAAALATVKTDSPLLDASIKSETIRNLSSLLACPPAAKPTPTVRTVRIKPGTVFGTRCTPVPPVALPEVMRAYAGFKQPNTAELIRERLAEKDVIVRGTTADLLGELPPDQANARALIEALPAALRDQELNDAALSILDALAKQKTSQTNEAIKTALDSPDHLIRRRAVALLKTNGVGDFSERIGSVKTLNTTADYERAISRIGKPVSALVSTTKGLFTISLLPDEAPLNVDNFIRLAKRGYFRGITVHRVVPNFVIQDGDPRGDGNGGPGYQIRCEINEAPYERAAVGMALSGKDTGGSQWFVTHSPQPHLEGGYTVFGNVVEGMNVVDGIVRGDVIRSIVVRESAPTTPKRKQ